MNVANASFSQMPFHHRIVTRSPNHMCASSWAITSATSASSAGSPRPVDEQRGLAVRDAAEVLHRALREVRERDHVQLLARVRDPVVSLEEPQAERPDVEREARARWPCPADARSAAARRPRRPARSPRAGRPRTRRGRSTSPSCRRTGSGRGRRRLSARPRGRSRSRAARGFVTIVTPKTAFRSGSSQHGNALRASVDSNCVVAIVWAPPSPSV